MIGYFKYSIIALLLLTNVLFAANNGIAIATLDTKQESNVTTIQEQNTTNNIQEAPKFTQQILKDEEKKNSKMFVVDNILKKTSFNFIEEFFTKFGYTNVEVLQIKKVTQDLNELQIKINDKTEICFQNKNGFIINNQFISYEEIMKKMQEQDFMTLKNKLTSFIYTNYKEFLYVPFPLKENKTDLLVVIPYTEKDNISFEKLKQATDSEYNVSILYVSDNKDEQKCIISTDCMQQKNFFLQGNPKKEELLKKYNELIQDYKNLLDLPTNILFLKH